jgi:hypothetical protein
MAAPPAPLTTTEGSVAGWGRARTVGTRWEFQHPRHTTGSGLCAAHPSSRINRQSSTIVHAKGSAGRKHDAARATRGGGRCHPTPQQGAEGKSVPTPLPIMPQRRRRSSTHAHKQPKTPFKPGPQAVHQWPTPRPQKAPAPPHTHPTLRGHTIAAGGKLHSSFGHFRGRPHPTLAEYRVWTRGGRGSVGGGRPSTGGSGGAGEGGSAARSWRDAAPAAVAAGPTSAPQLPGGSTSAGGQWARAGEPPTPPRHRSSVGGGSSGFGGGGGGGGGSGSGSGSGSGGGTLSSFRWRSQARSEALDELARLPAAVPTADDSTAVGHASTVLDSICRMSTMADTFSAAVRAWDSRLLLS